jgi:hypothetical protein
MLLKGHNKVKLPQADFVKIATWIDANAPYYGTYRGKRGLQDKDHPEFRSHPVALKGGDLRDYDVPGY